jgi:hypothetical protein
MKIDSKNLRVQSEKTINLNKWPTKVAISGIRVGPVAMLSAMTICILSDYGLSFR